MRIKSVSPIYFQQNKSLLTGLQNRYQPNTELPPDSVEKSVDSTDKSSFKKYAGYAGGAAILAILTLIIIKRKLNLAKKLTKSHPEPQKPDIPAPGTAGNPQKSTTVLENTKPDEPPEKEKIDLTSIFKDNVFIKTVEIEDKKDAPKQVYAAQLYEKLSVKIPEIKLIGNSYNPKGMKITVTGALTDVPDNPEFYSKISENFAADAFLSNKNILKSCRVDKNGKIVRLILSDTMGVSPEGVQQHFGMVVDEISDFFNPGMYPDNAKVYSNLDRKSLIKSLEKIALLKSDDIRYADALSDDSKILNRAFYIDKLIARKDFLSLFLEELKAVEQKDLSIKDYAQLIKIRTIKRCLQDENSYGNMMDIKYSIEKLPESDLKKELNELYLKREKELTRHESGYLSLYETEKLLQNYMYCYDCTPEELNKLKQKYGEYAGKAVNTLTGKNCFEPLNLEKISDIAQIINENEGKYIDFWKNNPDLAVMYINSGSTKAHQLDNFKDESWDFVIKNFKRFCERDFDKEAVESLIRYSGFSSYDNINGVLRVNYLTDEIIRLLQKEQNLDGKISAQIQGKLENLKFVLSRMNSGAGDVITENLKSESGQSLLESLSKIKDSVSKFSAEKGIDARIAAIKRYAVPADKDDTAVLLLRNATTDELGTVILENGESLLSCIEQASGNPSLLGEILKDINQQKPVLCQPGFLSTSIAPYSTLSGNVKWFLKMSENVKYNYLNDIEHIFNSSNSGTEAEVLVNPGHKIKIKNAEYKNGKWKLYGEIFPPEYASNQV